VLPAVADAAAAAVAAVVTVVLLLLQVVSSYSGYSITGNLPHMHICTYFIYSYRLLQLVSLSCWPVLARSSLLFAVVFAY
jgi:hypothetical protein